MLSIIPLYMLAMACAKHMLTIVMAMAREVGRSADKNVVKINTIYARYMLRILNIKKCRYMLIICQDYT